MRPHVPFAASRKESRETSRALPTIPLRYSADWRSLCFLALLFILFFFQWTGLLRHWALLPITCFFAFIACIIKHNHIHCQTFTNRHWNRALEFLLGAATGQSTAAIIPVHNERHHAQNHTEHDLVRSSLVNFRWNWLNLLAFPFAVVWRVHQAKHSDLARWHAEKPALYRRVQWERAFVLVFFTILMACDWRATLLYFGVPWLFAQWGIVTINLLQHQDCDPDSAHDHSRNITGALINWFFLNNGYHTAHHLRPALHWSLVPEFHRQQIAPCMRPDLNHRSLFICTWKQFFSAPRRSRP